MSERIRVTPLKKIKLRGIENEEVVQERKSELMNRVKQARQKSSDFDEIVPLSSENSGEFLEGSSKSDGKIESSETKDLVVNSSSSRNSKSNGKLTKNGSMEKSRNKIKDKELDIRGKSTNKLVKKKSKNKMDQSMTKKLKPKSKDTMSMFDSSSETSSHVESTQGKEVIVKSAESTGKTVLNWIDLIVTTSINLLALVLFCICAAGSMSYSLLFKFAYSNFYFFLSLLIPLFMGIVNSYYSAISLWRGLRIGKVLMIFNLLSSVSITFLTIGFGLGAAFTVPMFELRCSTTK